MPQDVPGRRRRLQELHEEVAGIEVAAVDQRVEDAGQDDTRLRIVAERGGEARGATPEKWGAVVEAGVELRLDVEGSDNGPENRRLL